jgi:hypothetical protein
MVRPDHGRRRVARSPFNRLFAGRSTRSTPVALARSIRTIRQSRSWLHDNSCSEQYVLLTSGNIVRHPKFQGTCALVWFEQAGTTNAPSLTCRSSSAAERRGLPGESPVEVVERKALAT